jgi:hypothetical protein
VLLSSSGFARLGLTEMGDTVNTSCTGCVVPLGAISATLTWQRFGGRAGPMAEARVVLGERGGRQRQLN